MAIIAITPYSKLNKETILIGANCLSDKSHQERTDKELQIINPYQNHNDIAKAAEYCWNVSLEYCDYLGNLLNEIQGVSYSSSYWKTILLPWVIAFVENLYDRYLRLRIVRENFPDAVIEIPKIELSFPLYKKSFDVWTQAHLHSINTKIYSLLIELMGLNHNIKYLDINIEDSENNMYKFNQTDFTVFFKRNIKKLIKTLNIWKWMDCPLGNVPSLRDEGFLKQPIDRGEITFEHTDDEFKFILHNFMRWALPVSLLEEYRGRNITAKEFLLKKNIRAVNISNTFWVNDTLKFLIAEVRENSGKIIGNQHGGGYGNYVIATPERIEREIADFFISWGWTDKRTSPTIPLPDPRLSKLANTYHGKNKKILFIGTHGPMYMFRYQSYWMPEFVYQKFYHMKRIFFQKLKEPIQKHIVYRPYPHEYGWQERDRIKEILPDVYFNEYPLLSVQSMKDYSLVVIDHPSTSFLESLVINAPTILFWDNEQCPMREEANPYFQLLLDKGILYYNPEDAANKVNEIWDDVQGWWQKPEVQKAKDDFCWRFARTSKNWRKEWRDFLRTLK